MNNVDYTSKPLPIPPKKKTDLTPAASPHEQHVAEEVEHIEHKVIQPNAETSHPEVKEVPRGKIPPVSDTIQKTLMNALNYIKNALKKKDSSKAQNAIILNTHFLHETKLPQKKGIERTNEEKSINQKLLVCDAKIRKLTTENNSLEEQLQTEEDSDKKDNLIIEINKNDELIDQLIEKKSSLLNKPEPHESRSFLESAFNLKIRMEEQLIFIKNQIKNTNFYITAHASSPELEAQQKEQIERRDHLLKKMDGIDQLIAQIEVKKALREEPAIRDKLLLEVKETIASLGTTIKNEREKTLLVQLESKLEFIQGMKIDDIEEIISHKEDLMMRVEKDPTLLPSLKMCEKLLKVTETQLIQKANLEDEITYLQDALVKLRSKPSSEEQLSQILEDDSHVNQEIEDNATLLQKAEELEKLLDDADVAEFPELYDELFNELQGIKEQIKGTTPSTTQSPEEFLAPIKILKEIVPDTFIPADLVKSTEIWKNELEILENSYQKLIEINEKAGMLKEMLELTMDGDTAPAIQKLDANSNTVREFIQLYREAMTPHSTESTMSNLLRFKESLRPEKTEILQSRYQAEVETADSIGKDSLHSDLHQLVARSTEILIDINNLIIKRQATLEKEIV